MRAPAWFTVAIGSGMALFAGIALSGMPPTGEQVFIGRRLGGPLLMVDAYALWETMLLGGILAVAAWVPGARRSLVPHTTLPFTVILLLTWFALLMLYSVQLPFTLFMWVVLTTGVIVLWAILFRASAPRRLLEVIAVIALISLLGATGLYVLQQLGQQNTLTDIWSPLLSASPRSTNGAVLLLILGWFGPAAYLPWWVWSRREEQAMVWLPGALLFAMAGVAVLIRVLFFAFPAASAGFTQITGLEQTFLIKRTLGWMLAWGTLAVLIGAGWLTYGVIRRQRVTAEYYRPLSLVSLGMLIISLGIALQVPQRQAISGLLWWQLTWIGVLAIWITGSNVLTALIHEERGERRTVAAALLLAVVMLVSVPFTPGYWGLVHLWPYFPSANLSRPLILVALIMTALGAIAFFPQWLRSQAAAAQRPGAGWGILAPFAAVLALLTCSLFIRQLGPIFDLIRISLLQAY